MERREKLVSSAANCFLRSGFTETSLDEIVADAGVVKQTLYNYFDSKDALFKEAIELLTSQTAVELDFGWYQLSTREFLSRVATKQLQQFKDSRTTDFLRLLVKECRKYPQLQEIYSHSIPQPTIKFIAGYFDRTLSNTELQRLAWCFRAALTGYASLSNLGAVANFNLPNQVQFIEGLIAIFEQLFHEAASLTTESAASADFVQTHVQLAANHTKSGTNDIPSWNFRPSTDKKSSILTAALETFSSKGFADTSMEEVATVAKTSKQTLYKYFKNKNVLYSALCEEVVSELRNSSLPPSEEQSQSFAEYVINYSQSFIARMRTPWLREYFRMVIGESRVFPNESGALLLYLFSFGTELLVAHLSTTNKSPLALAVICRGILGSFLLSRQIYSVGDGPYISEQGLIETLNAIVNAKA